MTNVPGPQRSCGHPQRHIKVNGRIRRPPGNRPSLISSGLIQAMSTDKSQKQLIEILIGKREFFIEIATMERSTPTFEQGIRHKIKMLKELKRETIQESAEKLTDIVLKESSYPIYERNVTNNHKILNALFRSKVAILLLLNDQATPELVQGLEKLLSQMEQDEDFVKRPVKRTLAAPLFIGVNVKPPVNSSGRLNIAYVNLFAVYIKAAEKLQVQKRRQFAGQEFVQNKFEEILKL